MIENSILPCFVDRRLEKISNKDKEKWGEWVTLSQPSLAVKRLARYAIEDDRRSACAQDIMNPLNPFVRKPFVFEYL